MSFLINPFVYLAPGATLTADAGTFNLTGVNASFLRALRMQAAAGSFTLTGNDAGLVTGNPPLDAETGTFTLTGNAAALSRALRMAASAGSFSLTGNAAALSKTVTLLASGGTFALTGISASFARALVMAAVKATFTLTGNAATLTYKDPNFSSVVLLLGFEGVDGATSTTDESSAAHSITFNGNAQIDTAQQKFGSSSLLLDGTGDYLTSADSADWDFGAGQFTIEFFVRYNSVTDVEFISQWDVTVALSGWKMGRLSAGLHFHFYDTTDTLRSTGSVAWTPSTGQWYHVCVDRDASGNVRRYVDGVMLGTAVNLPQTAANRAKALSIGRIDHSTPRYLNGWMDEIRITKGVARYASDSGFTVPTAAYPRA